jgi:uncharacterized protein (DUF433 family)
MLYEYLYRERTAEEIQQLYPSLTLAEVYTTILYYLLNQESVSRCQLSSSDDGRDPETGFLPE